MQDYLASLTFINKMDLSDRFKKILEHYGMNPPKFAQHVGFKTPQAVRDILNRKTLTLSESAEFKVCQRCPDINIQWLKTGEGEMLKDSPTVSDNPDKGKPFFDMDYALGFSEYLDSSSTPDYYIKVPGYDKATLWCRTSGHSMEPEISSGDIIALQLIEDPSFLVMGEIYAIETDNGMRTVKRLRRGREPGTFLLVPANPDYDSQEIEAGRIIRVFRVLGAIKPF